MRSTGSGATSGTIAAPLLHVGGDQPLGMEHRQAPRASARAELSDRLVGLADRRPQRGGRVRIAEIVLHIDDQDRGALTEADALAHALPSVEVGGYRFGVGRHDCAHRPHRGGGEYRS
jgi:hypothetical protein